MTRLVTLLTASGLALTASLALAQDENASPMEGMDHSGHPGSEASAAMGNFLMTAMDTMWQTMPMESSGNVDADFLLMMIPHHQSAIAMARVVLERGQDEETRAMAQAIIDAQEAEIAEMHAVLERLGVEPRPPATE